MNQKELNKILNLHKLWLENDPKGERADLTNADLIRANLIRANLTNADLRCADLTDAILSLSCWPLWCGTRGVKVDIKIVYQLCYHICWLDCDSKIFKAIRKFLLPFANRFYRIGKDCEKLK